VNPATATALTFLVQPSDVVSGAAISPAPRIQILDAFANLVTSATNGVAIAFGSNPPGGALSGTLTQPAVAGVATFGNLSVDRAGAGYTLSASASGISYGCQRRLA
jgi:hypothetical protein